MSFWGVVASIGFLSTSVFMFPTVWLLRRFSVIDVPNHRSSHRQPVPRGGGLALGGGVVVASVWADQFMTGVTIGALIFMCIGAADDLRSRSAVGRLLLQVTAAAGACYWILGPRFALVAVGCVVVVVTVNATNFMDGINGISGLHACIWGLFYSSVLACAVQPAGEFAPAAAILGAGAAFLPWNLVRARVFLGDSGSYLIGAIAGLCTVSAASLGMGFAAVAPLTIYGVDTISAVARHMLRGDSVMEAHRDHVYQQLVDRGCRPIATALLVAFFTGSCTLLSWLCVRAGSPNSPILILSCVAIAIAYLSLPRLASLGSR